MSRFKTLIAVVSTLLLLALLAGMALAASGEPAPNQPSGAPGGYGYGYDGGDPGDGDDGGFDPCSFAVCRAIAAGRVVDADTGAPLPGATVALQRRTPGGAWVPVPDDALRPTANPLASDAAGRFTWLVRGSAADQLRVLVTLGGYAPGASAARTLSADDAFDVALTRLRVPPGDQPAPASTDAPVPPASQVGGVGTPVAPKPRAVAATPKGCAAKKGSARTACLRAQKLARALKACAAQKGARRTTCRRRARALSACDAKKGRKRTACRAKALAIGRTAHRPRHHR
jgi:Carboxypeptidase regulatory-like domain